MTDLLQKAIDISGNEFAMGYNDSGCFWRFFYGKRGAGSMMDGWPKFESESPDVYEALAEYIAYMETDLNPYINRATCQTNGCTYTCCTLEELEAHLLRVHLESSDARA